MKTFSRGVRLVCAVLAATMLIGMSVCAGSSVNGFRIEQHYVDVNRGGSVTVPIHAKKQFSIFEVGSTSKTTRAAITGPMEGDTQITFYVGPDETASVINYYFYLHGKNSYNQIDVRVRDANLADAKAVPVVADTYEGFNQMAASKVAAAPQSATVTVEAGPWESFCNIFFDALKKRPDVAVVVNFSRDGKNYTTTIPAMADLSLLQDEAGYCGFLKICAVYGGAER